MLGYDVALEQDELLVCMRVGVINYMIIIFGIGQTMGNGIINMVLIMPRNVLKEW